MGIESLLVLDNWGVIVFLSFRHLYLFSIYLDWVENIANNIERFPVLFDVDVTCHIVAME